MPDLDAQLAAFYAAHRPRQASLAGAEWRYLVAGAGQQTLLLLPGAPGIAEMAFAYISALHRRHRVIAPSYPGAVASLAQLLAGLLALIEREADGPIHLVGASYSGMVAQHLLGCAPWRFHSLLIGDTGVPRPARARALGLLRAMLIRLPPPGLQLFALAALRFVLRGQSQAHQFWQRYFRGVVADLRPAELANRIQIMIEMDRRPATILAADGWRRPTLLMETADDPLFSPGERAALRAQLPQAEIHTFFNRGHITALTRAPEYIAVMERFLERHG